MGIVLKQSFRTTVYTLAGTLLGAAVTFLQPGFLSKEAIGISRNMINIGSVAQSMILLGFHTVVITFLPRYEPENPKRSVLLTVGLMMPLAIGLFMCVPYFLSRQWIVAQYQPHDRPYLYRYFSLLPLLTMTWSYMTVLESYLATRMKVAASAFAREVLPRVFNAFLIVLFAAGFIELDGFMIGTALMYLLPVVVMILIARRTEHFSLSLNWGSLSRAEWKEAAHFAWYHLLAGITFQLIGFMDALMLAPLDKGGMKSVAVYTIAVLAASFVMIPYRAISAAASPLLNRAYIDKDMSRVRDIFQRSGINMTIAGIFMTVIIACNLPNMIRLLPQGQGYEAAVPLTLILIGGRLADIVTGLNNELLSISSHYKFMFRASLVLLVVFIALNRILIPQYSFYGAAWGATLSLLLYNVAKLIFLYKKFHLQPFNRGSLLAVLAGIGAAVAGYFLPAADNVFADAALRCTAITLVFGVLIYLLRPSPDINRLIQNLSGR